MKTWAKRAFYLSVISLTTGGIVAGITVPIVLNNTVGIDFVWDGEDDFITGGIGSGTGDDFLEGIVDGESEFTTRLTKVEYETAFFLYEKEQAGSLEYQLQYFKWDVIDLVQQIIDEGEGKWDDVNNDDSTSGADIKSRIESYIDRIETLEEKIEAIENAMLDEDAADYEELDYSSVTFSSNYPKIFLPLDEVRTKQEKVLNDYKDNFIKQFASRQEGLNQWPAERRSRYNGATSDSEALDYLTHSQVSSNAEGIFRYSINDEFTEKMIDQVWPVTFTDGDNRDAIGDTPEDERIREEWLTGEMGSEVIFSWAQNASRITEGKNVGEEENKVYFLSSDSRRIDEIFIGEGSANTGEEIAQAVAGQDLWKVNHMLLDIKQDATGNLLPWTVSKDTLKNLLAFYGHDTGTNSSKRTYEGFESLFDYSDAQIQEGTGTDVDAQSARRDTSSTLIQHFSNNSDATKPIMGSLGVMPSVQFVSSMVDGFGLGMLAIHEEIHNPGSINPVNVDIFSEFGSALADISVNWLNDPQNQNELDQRIDQKTDDEVNQYVGNALREVFSSAAHTGSDGLHLVYGGAAQTAGINRYAVVSAEHGIHFVQVTELDGDNLTSAIKDDLDAIANQQDTSKSEISFSDVFTSYFTTNRKIAFLKGKYQDGEANSYIEFIDAKLDENGEDFTFDDIDSQIDSEEAAEAAVEAASASAGKNTWYIEALENGTRYYDPSDWQLDPESIYDIAYKMARGNK